MTNQINIGIERNENEGETGTEKDIKGKETEAEKKQK